MRIVVDNVSYHYPDGSDALRDVSFSVERPELLTVVGPNGSGKSTLLKLLARIVEPTAGTISIADRALQGWPARDFARSVGYLAQNIELPFPMRAIDVVLSGRAPYVSRFRWESDTDVAAAHDALEKCDATGLALRNVNEMSGGEKKRVFLARVLAADPQLILLDEPVAGMTDAETKQTAELILTLKGERTLVVVEHDMEFVRDLGAKVTVLHEGSVLSEGTVDHVQNDPRVIEVYLGR